MHLIRLLFVLLVLVTACNPVDIDQEKPQIDLGGTVSFPQICDTLYFGESFIWKVRFSDNEELGAYSLEIHNNFNHHAHSTDIVSCEFDPDKEAENPYYTVREFDIPAGFREYAVEQEITLPLSDDEGVFDTGDYHFFIRLTDREGWSAEEGLSVKILRR